MKRASKLFTEEQKAQIDQAVQEAESKTSAEIVPAVATASGRYDRPEDIVGLWAGLTAAAVVWVFLPRPTNDPGSWGDWSGWMNLVILLGVMVAGFIIGAVIASNVGWLRRLFTSRRQMTEEVAARVQEAFATTGVYKTANATGLLIYVSLYERMARIQADHTVIQAIGQDALDDLCKQLRAKLREGDPAAALCHTIAAAGEKLAPALPKPQGNPDELPNKLLILD